MRPRTASKCDGAMQAVSRAHETKSGHRSGAQWLIDKSYGLLVLALAAAFFGLLFNRESTLSYSIGYNLYGSERVLADEVPYRDFHTLYPPATVYLNAALFKAFGISLYNALFGVFIFKVLTTFLIYACGRLIMVRS